MRKTASIKTNKTKVPLYTTTQIGKQKLEGFDVTGKTLSKTRNAQTKFGKMANKKIDQVKSKNRQQLKKDAYIKDLQSKVKTLDFEMRILKDKENEQKTEIQQMNRFFTDGIPINNNILALKTKYTQYEQGNIKSIDKLGEYQIELQDQQKQLQDENFKLKQILTTLQNDYYEQREKNEKNEENLAVILYTEQNRNNEYNEQYQKDYIEYKEMNDQNLKIQRAFEKKKILEPQQLEDRQLKIKTLKKQEQQRHEILLELEEQNLELKNKVDRDGFKKESEQQNNDLECYLLKVEKGITMCESRIGELQMTKKVREREKEQEDLEKRNLMKQIEDLREQLSFQQKISNVSIDIEVVKSNKKKGRCLDKETQRQKLLLNYQQDLKRIEEEEIDRLTGEKIQFQQDFLDEEQKRDQLLIDIRDLKENLLNLQKENIVIELVSQRSEQIFPEQEQQIKNALEKIPKLEEIKQQNARKLRHFQKLKKIYEQLNNLHIDDLKYTQNSNISANKNLEEFLFKIEKIKQMQSIQEFNQQKNQKIQIYQMKQIKLPRINQFFYENSPENFFPNCCHKLAIKRNCYTLILVNIFKFQIRQFLLCILNLERLKIIGHHTKTCFLEYILSILDNLWNRGHQNTIRSNNKQFQLFFLKPSFFFKKSQSYLLKIFPKSKTSGHKSFILNVQLFLSVYQRVANIWRFYQ